VKVGEIILPPITEEEESFGAVYRALYEQLVDFAERYVERDVAEDAVQEVMYSIRRRWKKVAAKQPSAWYFFRAVRNRIATIRLREYRQEKRLTRFLYRLARRDRDANSPDRRLENAELGSIIDDTVAAMPERCREAWVLVRENELSYDDAARALELAKATLKRHLTRAQALLRESIVDGGYHGEPRRIAASTPQKLLPAPRPAPSSEYGAEGDPNA
jgi:RNA polymerase sigma-70 factor (ECF subfamily)